MGINFILMLLLLSFAVTTQTDPGDPVGPGTMFSADDEAKIANLERNNGYGRSAAIQAYVKQDPERFQKMFMQSEVDTKGSKTDLPHAHNSIRKNFQTSLLPTSTHGPNEVKIANYVDANLFPDHPDLGASLNAFLQRLTDDKPFVARFTKLHFFILHELYDYLTKVYTTFNLTTIQNMSDLLANESKKDGAALNKKTLIITHLFSLIEAQINGYIQHQWPTLPQNLATTVGTIFNKVDYGTDYELMVRDFEQGSPNFTNKKFFPYNDPTWQGGLKNMQSNYLKTFGTYLTFTKSHTNALSETNKESGFNEFFHQAKVIKQKIDAMINGYGHPAKLAAIKTANAAFTNQVTANKATLTKATSSPADTGIYKQLPTAQIVDTMRTMEKLRPPLFFYSDITLRSVKIIPHLAQLIPPNSKKIGYPAKILAQAKSKQMIRTAGGSLWQDSILRQNYRVATFYDATGNETVEGPGATLMVNIPQGNGKVYRQAILPQPDWLNSTEGVMNMLRACLGDFSVLLRDPTFANEIILDPFIASIIYNAAKEADPNALGIPSNVGAAANAAAKNFIAKLEPNVDTSDTGGGPLPVDTGSDDDSPSDY